MVYTTMLGKKKSVGVLKNELQAKKIKNVSSYTFCQGRTMRWGLAWSFDETVKFPSCPFSTKKKPRPQRPLVFTVKPGKIGCTVDKIGQEVKKIIEDLKIEHTLVMSSSVVWSVSATARENTWNHSRRKRREKARNRDQGIKCGKFDSGEAVSHFDVEAMSATDGNLGTACSALGNIDADLASQDDACVDSNCSSGGLIQGGDNMDTSDIIDRDSVEASWTGIENSLLPTVTKTEETGYVEDTVENDGDLDNAATSSEGASRKKKKESMPLFECWVSVRKEKTGIILEMKWMEGTSKEALHQLFQYFKNCFR